MVISLSIAVVVGKLFLIIITVADSTRAQLNACIAVPQLWPVLSRFDRFFCNRAPRQRGPALRLLSHANLHFLPKLLAYTADADRSALGVLRDQTGSQIFSDGLSKCSVNSLYCHHQSTRKSCSTIVLVFK